MSQKPQSVFDAVSDAVLMLTATQEVRLANGGARALGLVTGEGRLASTVLGKVLKEIAAGRTALPHQIEVPVRVAGAETRALGTVVGASPRGDVFVVVKIPDAQSAADSPFLNLLRLLRETAAPELSRLASQAKQLAAADGADAAALAKQAETLSGQATDLAERIAKLGTLAEAHLQGPLVASDRIEACVLVRELLRGFADVIKQRALKVGLVGFDDDSPIVYGSRPWLERALREYLDQGLRQAKTGNVIEIRVQTLGGHVGIVVRNHGMTVPVQLRHSLLEPFAGSASDKRPSALPNVGLAICARVVQMHGGHVRIESHDEASTDFVLELPTGGPPSDSTALGLAQAQRYAEDLVALMRRRQAKGAERAAG